MKKTIKEIQDAIAKPLQPQINELATVLRFMFNNLDFRVKTETAQREYFDVIKPILEKYNPEGFADVEKVRLQSPGKTENRPKK